MELEEKRHFFLQKILSLAEINGWSNVIAEQVCLEMGLPMSHYFIWFPQGLVSIFSHLEQSYDQQMLEVLASCAKPLGVTSQVSFALQTRICDISSSQLLARATIDYYLKPSILPEALKFAWQTADLIWQYAGDRSLDYNYYTKRSLLQGVYIASWRCYIRDNSTGQAQTREFIQNSLEKIVSTGKCVKQAPKILRKIPFLRMFI